MERGSNLVDLSGVLGADETCARWRAEGGMGLEEV